VGYSYGGAGALGRRAGQIALGYLAHFTAIDADHPTLCALRPDQ
jgi:cytosine/adenosine deaminase-related metal-dependent hydrolase